MITYRLRVLLDPDGVASYPGEDRGIVVVSQDERGAICAQQVTGPNTRDVDVLELVYHPTVVLNEQAIRVLGRKTKDDATRAQQAVEWSLVPESWTPPTEGAMR